MVTGVVLAAGRSVRMGSAKPLLTVDDEPFVVRICHRMRAAGVAAVRVVLGHYVEDVVAVLPEGVEWVVNEAYDAGQLSSLQAGIRAGESAMMALVDHPNVEVSTYEALLSAHASGAGSIFLPVFGGRRGHPVVWDASVICELLEADVSVGARAVVRRDPGRVVEVSVEDPEILRDIDRPEDYQSLQFAPFGDPSL